MDGVKLGWWWGLPGAAVLFGLAAAFGGVDLGRRGVGVALLVAGAAGLRLVGRRIGLPTAAHGWAPVTGGVVAGILVLAALSSLLLAAGTWWASVLAAAWALVVVGFGTLASWCLVREAERSA